MAEEQPDEGRLRVPEDWINQLQGIAGSFIDTSMEDLTKLLLSPQREKTEFKTDREWHKYVQQRNYCIKSAMIVVREFAQWMSGRVHLTGANTQEEVERNKAMEQAFTNALKSLEKSGLEERRKKIAEKDPNGIYTQGSSRTV